MIKVYCIITPIISNCNSWINFFIKTVDLISTLILTWYDIYTKKELNLKWKLISNENYKI